MAGRAEGVSGPEFFCDGENDIVGEAGAEARDGGCGSSNPALQATEEPDRL